MKKNNRDQYLKTWLTYLKGKNQLDPKALADFLKDMLKGALSPTTMKRYTSTVIANLYENDYLTGKTGKTFSGKPLEIIREITPNILDQALTGNYKKIKFTESDQSAEMVESLPQAPKAKKPKKAVAAKAKKTSGRKPGRKAGKKATPKVPAATEKKPDIRKPGLVGDRADLVKMGEEAFLYSLELRQRVEDLEVEIAGYERMFEAVRELFSREMDEIEGWLARLLE